MATATSTLQNFIDGEFVDPVEGETEPVLNPATGEVIAQAPLSSAADVDRAVKAAGRAFEGWATTTPGERALALLKLADAIEEHAEEISELEADNAGKPINAFRDDEIPFMVDNLRFFAGAARCLEGRASGEYLSGYTSMIRREPVGVVGQIAPWNYPLMMAIWKIGPALAAGNTIVLKPAETTPMTTLKLAELAGEIFPKGVLNVITGHGDPAGQALVTHEDVSMVSLTGSVETGKWIAQAAADTLKRVHLELGGKAPVVVFDDVDMATAMETIAGTGYYNAGQDCTAATRVLAGSKVYDDVVSGLVEQAQGLVLGDTRSGDTTLGPLNSSRQRERVEGFLERRPSHVEIATGGKEPDRPGFFLEPTVVAGLEAGRRDDPARDLRPGDHRAAVQRRGRGDRLGQRDSLRPRLIGLDAGRGAGDAGRECPALRVRVDQRPHPARLGDAPRRVQAVRLRQGPQHVRARGLHRGQARDGFARLNDLAAAAGQAIESPAGNVEASTLRAPAVRPHSGPSIGVSLLRLRSDEQLVALFRAGSDDAFRAIHDRYRQRLFAYARQMLPGRQDAEDALQDVFVRAYAGLRANDREVALRAWLYRVAHNRCVDELRRPLVSAGRGI